MERELGDIDYSDIEAKYEVPFDDSLDNVIIINGIPVITSAKQQKLFEAIQKRFRTQAEIEVPLECMHIQYGDSGDSKGYILMELASGDEASHAIRTMDGYAFDKKHHFVVTRFSDIERLVNMDETYVDPEEEPYKQRGTCARGSPTPRAAISSPSASATMSRSPGTTALLTPRWPTAGRAGPSLMCSGRRSEPILLRSTCRVLRSGVAPPGSGSCDTPTPVCAWWTLAPTRNTW